MKIFTGVVVNKKMNKTASVEVDRVVKHPIYGKRLKRTKIYHVRDEKDTKVGDKVKFMDSKPYSKTVKWVITEIVTDKVKKAAKTKKK